MASDLHDRHLAGKFGFPHIFPHRISFTLYWFTPQKREGTTKEGVGRDKKRRTAMETEEKGEFWEAIVGGDRWGFGEVLSLGNR